MVNITLNNWQLLKVTPAQADTCMRHRGLGAILLKRLKSLGTAKQLVLPPPRQNAGLGSSPVVCPIELADSQDERDEDEGDHSQAPGRAKHEHEDDGCLGG